MTAADAMTTEKHYRFALIADVHIDLEDGGKKIYFVHAERNFERALRVIKERGCDFIVSAGDQVTNATGAKDEWIRYNEIIEQSEFDGAVYASLGNHEVRFAHYGGCSLHDCHEEFITYAGLGEKDILREKGKTYYCYIDKTFGDAFLFLSLENGVNTNEIDNFTDEQMDWAEELIERFEKERRRIFLIQHAPIYGFGAGDDAAAPAYEGSLHMEDHDGLPFRNNRRFRNLIEKHRDLIWLSGHTHLDLREDRNYSTANGSACHMIHIPALAGTTRRLNVDKDGKPFLDRTFYDGVIQGYLVDVFCDRVTFSGINFHDDTIYPQYVYTIRR